MAEGGLNSEDVGLLGRRFTAELRGVPAAGARVAATRPARDTTASELHLRHGSARDRGSRALAARDDAQHRARQNDSRYPYPAKLLHRLPPSHRKSPTP